MYRPGLSSGIVRTTLVVGGPVPRVGGLARRLERGQAKISAGHRAAEVVHDPDLQAKCRPHGHSHEGWRGRINANGSLLCDEPREAKE